MMDTIFGRDQFRNEIVWKRTAGRAHGNKFGRVHDVFSKRGEGATWNTQWMEHDPEYVAVPTGIKTSRPLDGRPTDCWEKSAGAWAVARSVERHQPANDRNWNTPIGCYDHFLKDYIPGWPEAYGSRPAGRFGRGFIYWPPSGGMPRLKRYLRHLMAGRYGTSSPTSVSWRPFPKSGSVIPTQKADCPVGAYRACVQ